MRCQQFASHADCGAAGPVSKMASQQEKALCVLRFEVSRSVITVQREFRARFRKDAPCMVRLLCSLWCVAIRCYEVRFCIRWFASTIYLKQGKNQLDATCYFIVLLIDSTCFAHYYAHHQELATIMLITTLVYCSWFPVCWTLGAVRLEWCPGCRLEPAARTLYFRTLSSFQTQNVFCLSVCLSAAPHAPPTTSHSKSSSPNISESPSVTIPDVPPTSHLHNSLNIQPIPLLIHRLTDKFFAQYPFTPQPPG